MGLGGASRRRGRPRDITQPDMPPCRHCVYESLLACSSIAFAWLDARNILPCSFRDGRSRTRRALIAKGNAVGAKWKASCFLWGAQRSGGRHCVSRGAHEGLDTAVAMPTAHRVGSSSPTWCSCAWCGCAPQAPRRMGIVRKRQWRIEPVVRRFERTRRRPQRADVQSAEAQTAGRHRRSLPGIFPWRGYRREPL